MDVQTTENPDQEITRTRDSKYSELVNRYQGLDEGQGLTISGLTKGQIQGLRNAFYNRLGKESVIVESTKVGEESDGYKAVVRQRKDGEYLRTNGEDTNEE